MASVDEGLTPPYAAPVPGDARVIAFLLFPAARLALSAAMRSTTFARGGPSLSGLQMTACHLLVDDRPDSLAHNVFVPFGSEAIRAEVGDQLPRQLELGRLGFTLRRGHFRHRPHLVGVEAGA